MFYNFNVMDSNQRRPATGQNQGADTEREQRRQGAAKRRVPRGRQRRRAARAKGIFILAIAAVLAVLAIRFLPPLIRQARQNDSEAGADVTVRAVDAEEVLHLTFPALYTPDGQSNEGGALTVKQFRRILEDLYARDYVLVNFYSLVTVGENSISRADLEVPDGKKPLVISQSGMHYTEGGDGYPVSMQFSGAGGIVNSFKRANGTDAMGIYDVIPVVEEFLQMHPDFSFQGARGLVALSGQGGTFGFDSATDERFTQLITELRSRGWHFASNGYGDISYGSDVELVREDAENWQQAIGQHLGTTDTLIFPRRSDIGRWSGYTQDNEKFALLSELGFRYFCVEDDQNFTWMQTGDNYMRQVVHRIDSYAAYESVLQLAEI